MNLIRNCSSQSISYAPALRLSQSHNGKPRPSDFRRANERLDKDGVNDMRQYLLNLKEQEKTILIASHSAEDIDVLCDTVCEMDKGKLEQIR